MRRGLFLMAVLLPWMACSPKLSLYPAAPGDITLVPRSPEEKKNVNACYDPLAYAQHPELFRTRYIRVNFHFMGSRDGVYGLPPDEVKQYARDWLYSSNYNLARNEQMYLPHGNQTPVLPIPYRYVLTPDPHVPGDDGIYYHADDSLCIAVKTGRDRNISDKRVIQKYAVQLDSVLNIFVQAHHLDSIPSKTYKADISGISLGTAVKIFGKWNEKPSYWDYRGILNHEIGHTLGLSHTWGGYDGCDDTPAHPNCWNVMETPPCDSLYSNNMMDYNIHWAALTPCQIGKELLNMAKLGSLQRNLLVPTWCQLDTSANLVVRDTLRLDFSIDLEGNVIIDRGGYLEIGCRVSMPEHSTITIRPGGTLSILSTGWIHNACHASWDGILLESRKKEKGKVIVIEGGRIENCPVQLIPASGNPKGK